MNKFDTAAARVLARGNASHPYWVGEMRQTLEWACDIIDAANKALNPQQCAAICDCEKERGLTAKTEGK